MGITCATIVCLSSWRSRNMKNISHNIKYAGKKIALCYHYCQKKVRNTEFFHWFTHIEGKLIKTMCISCALREAWGYNYKSNKHYKKLIINE